MEKNMQRLRSWVQTYGVPPAGTKEHMLVKKITEASAKGRHAVADLGLRLLHGTNRVPVRPGGPAGSRSLPSTVPETAPVKRVPAPAPAATPAAKPLDVNRVLDLLHATAKHIEKKGWQPPPPPAPRTGPPPGFRPLPQPGTPESVVPLTVAPPDPPVPLTHAPGAHPVPAPKKARLLTRDEARMHEDLQRRLAETARRVAKLARNLPKPGTAGAKYLEKNTATEPVPMTKAAKTVEKKGAEAVRLEPTRAQLFQKGIHAAFRGTGVAYHTLRLLQNARNYIGEKGWEPLTKQAKAILQGKREATLKTPEGKERVNPFSAFGRWFKLLASGGTVPAHLGDLADRFNWETADRRHSLDAQLYDLFHDYHGKGDHGRTDRLITNLYHQSRSAPEAARNATYSKIRAALGKRVGDLPSNFNDELHKSLERLYSYALDRRMIAEDEAAATRGKLAGKQLGNIGWREWFKGASRAAHGGKTGDPLRLSRPSLVERVKRLLGLSRPPTPEEQAWSQHMAELTGGEALPAQTVEARIPTLTRSGSNADAPKGIAEAYLANNRHRDTLREALLASGHNERDASQYASHPDVLAAWRHNGVAGLIDSEAAAGRHGTAREIGLAGVRKLRQAGVLPYHVDEAVEEKPAPKGQLDLWGRLAEETKQSRARRSRGPKKPGGKPSRNTPTLPGME